MLRATALTRLANFVELNSSIYRCLVYSSLDSSKHWFRNGPSSRDAPVGRSRETGIIFGPALSTHSAAFFRCYLPSAEAQLSILYALFRRNGTPGHDAR